MKKLGGFFKLEEKKIEITSLENKIISPNFWNEKQEFQKVGKRLSFLKKQCHDWDELYQGSREQQELLELVNQDSSKDANLIREISLEINNLKTRYRNLELQVMLSGQHDHRNAIMSINSGAGGTESCDWSMMLFRMYSRWAESQGWKHDVMDMLLGEEAGLKRCSMLIEGDYAYGRLQSEIGVHRLVRISPFDSNRRRHTSFSAVSVLPEMESSEMPELQMSDLRIDTYRAQGAGGQHVNKTDSAIRITHVPTGIVVQSQTDRSQLKNKEHALKALKTRLYELEEEKKRKEVEREHSQKEEIAWGRQVRSYVFHPYVMIKDHRTNFETGDGKGVMEGSKLDDFINAFLKWNVLRSQKK